MLRKYVLSWRLNVLVEVHNFNEVGKWDDRSEKWDDRSETWFKTFCILIRSRNLVSD